MTPYLMCLEPRHANHEVCTSGRANPIFQIQIAPWFWIPLADQYATYKAWHLNNPNRPKAVLWGRMGTEGFNIDERDGQNNLIGCTRDQFERGMAGGGFKRTNDMAALNTVSAWMRADGLLPEMNMVDLEPSTTPLWNEPLPVRANFDRLKWEHLYGCLRDAQLLDFCKSLVIEFTQFAAKPEEALAWDYNGAPVPFLKPVSRLQWRTLTYTKTASSTELYTTPDNRATIALAAWLWACAPGASPVLQPADPIRLRQQFALCEKAKATPIVYTNPIFNGIGDTTDDMSREERAEHERRRQSAMDWQVGQLHYALTQTGST